MCTTEQTARRDAAFRTARIVQPLHLILFREQVIRGQHDPIGRTIELYKKRPPLSQALVYDEDGRAFQMLFYRGRTARPDTVRRAIAFFSDYANVLIYFHDPYDEYTPSVLKMVKFSGLPGTAGKHATYTTAARNRHSGRNVLIAESPLTEVGPDVLDLLDLSCYKIAGGPRDGFPAASYFMDGKRGQRVACLRRTGVGADRPIVNSPQYVRIHMRTKLRAPMYALTADSSLVGTFSPRKEKT